MKEQIISGHLQALQGMPHDRCQYDDPSITPDNQTVLQADMVLNIETPYYELGWGGVQVEDTVAITENGAVRLDVSDNHLIVLDI